MFFFSAANPSIESGGMLGESKYKILENIPGDYKPKTFLIKVPLKMDTILAMIQEKKIPFPLIAKPDVGERGWKVEKIHDKSQLEAYVKQMRVNFIIQEYIPFEIELGLFYFRLPNQMKGVISSIVIKEFLTLKGNGKSTFNELIMNCQRARLQYFALEPKYRELMNEVLPNNQKFTLVQIGNHCLGTKFLNGNHLINNQLIEVFDKISQSIPGFYYGRYDIRCKSLNELYKGKEIKILELNGAGAEPGHIYDPQFPIFKAYRVLFHHWKVLYQISKANHKRGTAYMSVKDAWQTIMKIRQNRKLMTEA
jgi:hypothetical protein